MWVDLDIFPKNQLLVQLTLAMVWGCFLSPLLGVWWDCHGASLRFSLGPLEGLYCGCPGGACNLWISVFLSCPRTRELGSAFWIPLLPRGPVEPMNSKAFCHRRAGACPVFTAERRSGPLPFMEVASSLVPICPCFCLFNLTPPPLPSFSSPGSLYSTLRTQDF